MRSSKNDGLSPRTLPCGWPNTLAATPLPGSCCKRLTILRPCGHGVKSNAGLNPMIVLPGRCQNHPPNILLTDASWSGFELFVLASRERNDRAGLVAEF